MTEPKADLYTAPLDGTWQKSSYSSNHGEDCVRLMPIDGGIALGDSKRPDLPPLRYTPTEMAAFIKAAKNGEFDHLIEP